MNDIPLNKYASILKQPYTKSRLHPRMPDSMRAVQFSPLQPFQATRKLSKKYASIWKNAKVLLKMKEKYSNINLRNCSY